MAKPIIKWIVGGQKSRISYDVLRLSVNLIKRLYKDRFDLFVCYNGLNKDQIKYLPDITLVNQETLPNVLTLPPPEKNGRTAWKLYPPRLRQSTHEITLDNDLILYDKLEEIETFLDSEDVFLATEDRIRAYNNELNNSIRQGFNINTGLVGLPPNFDLAKQINHYLLFKNKWQWHLDEQSILASILQHKKTVIINRKKLQIPVKECNYEEGSYGIHFVGLNGGNLKHWNNFMLKWL